MLGLCVFRSVDCGHFLFIPLTLLIGLQQTSVSVRAHHALAAADASEASWALSIDGHRLIDQTCLIEVLSLLMVRKFVVLHIIAMLVVATTSEVCMVRCVIAFTWRAVHQISVVSVVADVLLAFICLVLQIEKLRDALVLSRANTRRDRKSRADRAERHF